MYYFATKKKKLLQKTSGPFVAIYVLLHVNWKTFEVILNFSSFDVFIVNCVISDFPFFFSDMFLAAGEHLKAIEIIGQHGWVEKWVSFINFWNLEDWKQFDILEKYNHIDRAISFIIVGDQNSKQTKLQGEASAGKIITSTLSRPLMSRHFTYTKSNYTFALANFFFSSSHSDL